MLFVKTLISLNLFCNLGIMTANSQITVPQPKVIKSAYTNIPETNNWVTVPKGTEEITIYIEAENTETVLFWLIPTGTQTWWERSLIGYAINTEKERTFNSPQTFSLTWKIDKPFLHDHIEVQLIGMNEITGGGSINITMDRNE